MKFQLTFKTPDVLDQLHEVIDDDEQIEADQLAKKFLRYGEYITIEFDSEIQSATVLRS